MASFVFSSRHHGGILRFGRRRTGRHVVGNTAADTFRHAALEGRVIVTSFDGVSVQTKYDCVTLHVHIKFTSGMSFFFFFNAHTTILNVK